MKTIDEILKLNMGHYEILPDTVGSPSWRDPSPEMLAQAKDQISEIVKEIIGEKYINLTKGPNSKLVMQSTKLITNRAKERGIEV